MFYLRIADVCLCASIRAGRHTAALSYIAVGCFDSVWDGVGRVRCVGVSPCTHDRQPVQSRTNRTLRFKRCVPFQPQPDVCGHGLLAGGMGGTLGASAAVAVFGGICRLYDAVSNHARRTCFGAEIRCRVRSVLPTRPPLVIKAETSNQVSPLRLCGMK